MQDVEYTLGHSDHETRRLMVQAAIIHPMTLRLLREAGLSRGMRVLDLGCGAGDVTMLAADLVGKSGSVIGLDRNANILITARERARAAGYKNVTFVAGEVDDIEERFDLVVGRYILIHQGDPASLIRSAAARVRPGGVVAFHEVQCFGDVESFPEVPLWQKAVRLVFAGFATGMLHADAGARLIEHFSGAGLDVPQMFSEVPVGGGPNSPLYAWVALSLRSLWPRLQEAGSTDLAGIDVDGLEDRLREAVTSARSQVTMAQQYCAWTRV